MVDDDDAAAAIQTLVEIAQLNPTQARNALKHYGNSLENAVNAFFNGSLHFTETDGIRLPDDDNDDDDDDDDDDIIDREEEEEDLVMIDRDGHDRRRSGNVNRRGHQQQEERRRSDTINQQQQLVPLLPVRAVFGLLSAAVKITNAILSKILPANFVASVSRAPSQPTVLSRQC